MALTAMLYVDDPAERRGSPRRRVSAGTTVRRSGSAVDAVLHDLSNSGASIETAAPLAPGSTVTIGLAGVGRFAATVVTTSGLRAGCRFAEPLTSETLGRAFANNTVVAGSFSGMAEARVLAEPALAKYPGYLRVALPVAGAVGGWWMIVQVLRTALN